MRLLRYINALSLDVVAGALVCSMFFAKLLDIKLPLAAPICLALAVWSIYTIDHLWDARHSLSPATTTRHFIHKKYHTWFTGLVMLAILLGFFFFFSLPYQIQAGGGVIMLIITGYFITIIFWGSKSLFHKEILVATVYTGGILLSPFALAQSAIGTFHWVVAVQFCGLALSNLLLFTYFDTERDGQQNFGSFSRSVGQEKTKRIVCLLLWLIFSSAIIIYLVRPDNHTVTSSQWVIGLMSLPLIAIAAWPDLFGVNDRYRILGDATFYIPLLAL